MDFQLSEEQRAFQKAVKQFTEREIEPIAAQIDEDEHLPDGLIRKMSDLGLFGIALPKKYGGGEGSHLDAVLACEQIAYAGTGAWWLAAFHNSIPDSIAQFGSDEIKERYLRPLCDGSLYASIQFTEEDTGSNPKALLTTAVLRGDHYVINGTKRFSTFGARDGYAVLYAKDETGRCSAFVVEKNGAGYKATKRWTLMGGGGIEAVDVLFEQMKVPKEHLLGEQGKGFDILSYWIAAEKIEQCSSCVGMAQAALDEAVKYARSRMVRERPIADMQGIQWMLADMYAKMEAARWLTYRAAFLQDQKAPDWMMEAAAAKLFVMPVTLEVVETARRIHGAYGYSKEFKIERIYRAIAGATGIATSLEINKSIVGSWVVK
jgi:alkylation response protein AidB-like acyl-CoA dehydrogenase